MTHTGEPPPGAGVPTEVERTVEGTVEDAAHIAGPVDIEAPLDVEEEVEVPTMLRAVLDDRLLTLPNVITLSRLLVLPFWVPLVASEDHPAWAALILSVMGATDFVDGKVARRTGQVSELGKILDPAADRVVLIIAVLTIVLTTDAIPAWIAVPVLIREPIMFLAVPILGLLGAHRIDVTWFGKAGTFALMCCFPWLLYGDSSQPGADAVRYAGYAVGAIGVALSYYAALLYIPMARRALREGRAERAAMRLSAS